MLPIHSRFNARLGAALVAFALAGCASHPAVVPSAQWPAQLESALPTDVLLLGEQHDAPDHQRLQRDTVQWLAARGRLAAVVLEMAERGHSTAALARDATEAQVQSALQWNDAAWPWSAYGPVTMAAVRAGVPVLGGNLPRSAMAAATQETRWDNHLAAPARQQLLDALQDGHCGLLPATRLPAMARVQIARDASMALTAQEAVRPGQTVLLVAGGEHVLRHRGIPTHWPQNIRSKVASAHTEQAQAAIKTGVDIVVATPPLPPHDACEALRLPN
ncbi:MAG: ChaN family lipoprotein [Acidovorax sp.]|nr:ChaN family lipoprotein [Acidovorax sp.]